MSHPIDDPAACSGGPCLARNGLGSVTACGCGALTLAVGCLSLRLDPVALRELAGLLAQAARRLDAGACRQAPAGVPVSTAADDAAAPPRDAGRPLH